MLDLLGGDIDPGVAMPVFCSAHQEEGCNTFKTQGITGIAPK